MSIKRLAQVLIFKKSELTTNRTQHLLCNIFIVILFKIKLRITVFALIFTRRRMLGLTSLYVSIYIGLYINWFLNSVQVWKCICWTFHSTSWERLPWLCLKYIVTVVWHKVTWSPSCVFVCWIPAFMHLLRRWRGSLGNCLKSEESQQQLKAERSSQCSVFFLIQFV